MNVDYVNDWESHWLALSYSIKHCNKILMYHVFYITKR